jgi:hypothetical protein
VRENILRGLASQATKDPEFLRRARKDLEGTLILYGYHLTPGEMRVVEGLRRQTAGMSDEELAQTLTNGLKRRRGRPPTRPNAPGWRGVSPARPGS